MIRIAYISRINLLSGRTNVYNLTKTAEALNATENFSAEIVTTDKPRNVDEFFKKNAVHKPLNVVTLGVTDTLDRRVGQAWYELYTFLIANLSLIGFIVRKSREFDVIYFRDESLFPTAIFTRLFTNKKVFFEIHSVYERAYRQLKNILAARFSHGIVAISSGLKKHYAKYNTNILVSLCSAAEDSWFNHGLDKKDIRKDLNLPVDAFILGYTGVVGINPNNDYYEIDDVIRSLVHLPKNIILVAVGEINNNAAWLRKVAEESGVLDRFTLIPWQERSLISKYLQAFDAIVIPKRKKDLVGDSPAKMFPALASRRPIIAGRAESIQEVLTDGQDSIIVRENTPNGWAEAIQTISADHKWAEKISMTAEKTKAKYTWEKRGEAVAGFVSRSATSRSGVSKLRKRFTRALLLAASIFIYLALGKADKRPTKISRLVVILTGKLGDIVCGTPVLRAIRKELPDTKIIVAGNSKLQRAVLADSGLVDEYLDLEAEGAIERLKQAEADAAVVTGPAYVGTALCFVAGIRLISAPYVVGGYSPSETRPYKILQKFITTYPYKIGAYAPRERLRSLEAIGIMTDDTKKTLSYSHDAEAKVQKFLLEKDIILTADFIVGISPSAGNKIKEWPAEKFAEIADYVSTKHNARVVILGGPGDKEIVGQLVGSLKSGKNFTTVLNFNIDELKALMSKFHMFIAVDTGPIYIAEAFEVPTVDITGPIDENEQPPIGPKNKIVVPPSPRKPVLFVLNARSYDYNEAMRQINSITTDMVKNAVDSLVQEISK